MKKILIVNPFGVGDVLFTTPVIKALKDKFPDSYIGYLCQEQVAAILENHPLVDKMFFYTRGDLKKVKKKSYFNYIKLLIKAIIDIRREKFDILVDLSMVNQYSFALKLLGVKNRYGFDYKNRGSSLNHKIKIEQISNKHIVELYQDLLKEFGIKKINFQMRFYNSKEDQQFANNFLNNNGIKDEEVLFGIAPFGGASWGKDATVKHWPIEKYVDLIDNISSRYKCKIIIFGTKNDLLEANNIINQLKSKSVINAIGKTSLSQLAALIVKCNIFISNDSGPMHIACAKSVNTVSIFGPVDEKVYGPLGEDALHEIVSSDVTCRPCYKNFKKPECKKIDCLNSINIEMVMQSIEKIYKKTKGVI